MNVPRANKLWGTAFVSSKGKGTIFRDAVAKTNAFSTPLLFSFDDAVGGVREWLKQMGLGLNREPLVVADSQQGAPDTKQELERVENLHKELLERRYKQLFQKLPLISN